MSGSEQNQASKPALKRPISHYREILVLPLILRHTENPEEIVRALTARLAGKTGEGAWSEITNPLKHLGGLDQQAYEEYLYFYGFIQEFLYGPQPAQAGSAATSRGSTDCWTRRLFERRDLTHLTVELRPEKGPYAKERLLVTLNVDRMHLSLFGAGVAIFMVELSAAPQGAVKVNGGASEDLNLAHVLSLRNALRRAYPPFFERKNGVLTVSQYPAIRRWLRRDGREPFSDADKPEQYLEDFSTAPATPLARIWRHALQPLTITGAPGAGAGSWSQITDDRMPSFLFLVSSEAGQLTAGEWARLCYVDEPGEGLPYSAAWLDGFKRRHCFDMHWYKACGKGFYGTRYLFTSYSFAAVMTPDDVFTDAIQCHFRRHYFQLGLLNYFQFAALLAMSSWISDAVARYGSNERKEDLRRVMGDLQQRFLVFMQRCWFTNVSNHLQAREMYSRWRSEIGAEALYQEVAQQLGDAWQFLDAEAQAIQAEAATRLSVIATLAAVVGLPIAGLALADDSMFHKFKEGHRLKDVGVAAVAIGLSALAALLASWFIGLSGGVEKQASSRQFSQLARLLCLFFLGGTMTWLSIRIAPYVASGPEAVALALTSVGAASIALWAWPAPDRPNAGWLSRIAGQTRKKPWLLGGAIAAGAAGLLWLLGV